MVGGTETIGRRRWCELCGFILVKRKVAADITIKLVAPLL